MTSSKISNAPGGVAGPPESVEEPLHRRDQPHVGGDRLDDHTGHPVIELGDHVVGNHDRLRHRGGRHPGGIRQPEGGHPTAPSGQQPVGVTVIAAGELHDPGPAGRARGPPGWRSSPPRCPTTPAEPGRSRRPGYRWPRPAGPRPRSGLRRWCRDRRRRAPPPPPPGGRGPAARRRRTGRSRGAGSRRHPIPMRPRPGPRNRDARRPNGTISPGSSPRRVSPVGRGRTASERSGMLSHRGPRPTDRRSR